MFLHNLKLNFGLFLVLLLLVSNGSIHPKDVGSPAANNNQNQQIQGSLHNTRGYSRFNKGGSVFEEGNRQYFRSTTLDGNLVTGAISNNGLLSHANEINPPLSWPKGPKQVDYIFGAYFYVGSEVVDVNGDTIAIVSDYFPFGDEAPDGSHSYHFMPLPKYFNLDNPNAQTTPLIGGISEDVGEDGIPRTNDPGEGDGQLQPIEDFNNNGRLDLHLQNIVNWFATSHRKETWPEYWPAGSYPGDVRQPGDETPGVRAGRWNGEFGAYVRGDQEAYYVMDDRENDEFTYYPFPNDTSGWPTGRRGLGVTVEARTYQWNARLAEDILINIYDITNKGKDLEKCVVGMLVDPDLGGMFFNDEANFDTLEDITYTWNRAGRTSEKGLPIGYFGFAFLESPGLANDGIDNDLDGLIDESQSDGIDNDGDWQAWEDLNGNGVFDNEDTNYNLILDPGEDLNNNGVLDIELIHNDTGADGLGPQDFEYSGPDAGEANGVPDEGEPNFEFTDNDESDQVGLTSAYFKPHSAGMDNDQQYWDTELQPSTFFFTEDYRTDIAFTYGSGFVPFSGNEKTHRYAIALAFGNDFDDILRNKVTIQVIYDNDYNFAKPPLQPTVTAAGGDRKVYLSWDNIAERSTDPIYGNDFEGYRIYKSTDPTFTDIKTITDAFGNPLLFKPLVIFDLNDGLSGAHPIRLGSEIGGSSDLGITYDMGDDSGLRHYFIDEDVVNGRTYYYAISSIDKGYHPDFYPDISEKQNLAPISPTESSFNIQVDPLGRPISFDRNTAQVIPTEMTAGWVQPHVSDQGFEHVSGYGTGNINIIVYNDLAVKTGHRYRVTFEDNGQYENLGELYTGKMNQMQIYSVTDDVPLGVYLMPKNFDMDEKYIIDGLQFVLFNDSTQTDTIKSGWTSSNSTMIIQDNTDSDGSSVKRDFELRFTEVGAGDTSVTNRVMNFKLWDVTDPDEPFKQNFLIIDTGPGIGELDPGDKLTIVNAQRRPMWRYNVVYPAGGDTIPPQPGDVYKVVTRKSFDRNDVIEFTMEGNAIDNNKAKNELDDIYVVPDPYVAVNRLERKVLNVEEGRGERRIDFVNLPKECTISIFTVSGKFVQRIEYRSSEEKRRASWDLRTKDGLEIAHGMYFYAVEAPGIGVKTGKFAVIK